MSKFMQLIALEENINQKESELLDLIKNEEPQRQKINETPLFSGILQDYYKQFSKIVDHRKEREFPIDLENIPVEIKKPVQIITSSYYLNAEQKILQGTPSMEINIRNLGIGPEFKYKLDFNTLFEKLKRFWLYFDDLRTERRETDCLLSGNTPSQDTQIVQDVFDTRVLKTIFNKILINVSFEIESFKDLLIILTKICDSEKIVFVNGNEQILHQLSKSYEKLKSFINLPLISNCNFNYDYNKELFNEFVAAVEDMEDTVRYCHTYIWCLRKNITTGYRFPVLPTPQIRTPRKIGS